MSTCDDDIADIDVDAGLNHGLPDAAEMSIGVLFTKMMRIGEIEVTASA